MIELAARAWGFSVEATIAKLSSLGVPITADQAEVRTYYDQHLNYRKQVRAMWKQARDQYVKGDTEIYPLLHSLRCGCDVRHDRLAAGMGQLVGGISAKRAKEAVAPGAEIQQVFRGGSTTPWRDVIAIPFYDLPKRICAFLFIGRKGRPEYDYVFRRTRVATRVGRQWSDHQREGGLAMHPGVFDAITEWGGTVFCLPDPIRALQLHARHFGMSRRPLPIVAWWPSDAIATRHAWRMFEGKQQIIWAPTMTRQVIQMAIQTNAKISTAGPRNDLEENLDQYIWRQSTEELLAHIRDLAEPWPHVITKYFARLSDNELEELLLELKMSGVDLDRVTRRCPPALADRIRVIIDHQPVGRIILMEKKTIVERAGGWYVEGQRADQWELIMDAQLRIDQIIWQNRSGRAMYSGRLIHQEQEYAFCCPKDQLDKKSIEFLQELMLPHGKFVNISPSWRTRLTSVAIQFQAPQIIQGAEIAGWDLERMSFVMPKHSVAVGGEVKETTGVFPPGSPGEHLGRPETPSAQELAPLLVDEPVNGMLWAAISSVVANIIAPAFNQPTMGVGVVGTALSDIVRAVAEGCGCHLQKVMSGEGAPEKLRGHERAHRWPIWIDAVQTSAALVRYVNQERAELPHRNCLTFLPWHVATVQRLHGGWHILESTDVGGITAETRAAIRHIVPDYLLDLAERRFESDCISANENWQDAVLEDLADWLKRNHCDGDRVLAARAYHAEGAAEALADLTSQLVKEGKFVLVPTGYQDKKVPSILRLEEWKDAEGVEQDALAIPKQDLAAWAAKQYMQLDCAKVTAALAEANVLAADSDTHWIVPEKWWLKQLKLTQNEQTGLLRLRA